MGTWVVYILANRRYGTLYVGITNNLRRRREEHRLGKGSEFVHKYAVYILVHVDNFDDPEAAIVREKRLKKWNRDWKIALIERENPEWRDLADLIV
jgi:putative endonuclease